MERLDQAFEAALTFKPMSKAEMATLLDKTKQAAMTGKFEPFKINQSPRDQNKNFKPNWICLIGNARLVIWPGPWSRIWLGKLPPGAEGKNWVDADRKLFGGLKLGVLNMLNISARNCTFTVS
jgi:hypothetical protein